MASFDLNEMPAVDQDVPDGIDDMVFEIVSNGDNVPAGVDMLVTEAGEKRRSDTSTGEEDISPIEEMLNHNANEKIGQGGNEMGEADNGPLPGQWQACTPAQLPPSLYTQRQPVHYVISRRADATSEYAWRSWLPPKHASPGGAVIQPSERVTLPSIFTPRLARPGLASPAPGRGTKPDVSSAFFDPARAWSSGGVQQVEPSKTTTDVAANRDGSDKNDSHNPQSGNDHQMENSGMEDPSSEDSCITEDSTVTMPVGNVLLQQRNGSAPQEKSTLMGGGFSVRLVEVDSIAQDGREDDVPMPLRGNVLIHEKDGSAAQHLNPDHGEGETGPGSDEIRGAKLLQHLIKQERKKKREADFLASFTFGTELCNPTAPCKSCLEFFKAPVPRSLMKSRLTFQGVFSHHNHPPVLENMDAEEMAKRKESRHGPKSMSSEFRGVTFYKRTQRWESHVWHRGKQVYLGASATKEEAAKSYDKATLMMHGLYVDINYELTSYQKELNHIYKLNKKQLVMYLRRDSRGLGAQATYPGVKRVKNCYQATYKGVLWPGTFPTMEEAARKVYEAALKNGSGKLAAKIINTHHIRNMPSFARQYFAAVYPEEAEALHRQRKKRGRSRATKQEARASPPPVEKQLPARRKNLNGSVRVAAKRSRRT